MGRLLRGRAVAPTWALAVCLSCAGGPPAPPHLEPFAPAKGTRFIVGGDSRDDAAHVLPWAFREARDRSATAFLFLGDMELTPQLDAHFLGELKLLDPVPFYPALGNHEVRTFGFVPVGKAEAERSFRQNFLGTARTPVTSSIPNKVVYAIDLGGVHYVALDNVSQAGFGDAQLDWLKEDLARTRQSSATRHILVGMHKPLAHNGISTHGMDSDGPSAIKDSEKALDLFVENRVSLILASHCHRFAHYRQRGIESYITGGLGAPLDRVGADSFHHFLQLDVGDDVRVTVVRFDGTPSVGDEKDED